MARVSWRDYGLLGRHLQQTSDLCWAISLTRQFQHLLRLRGFIQPDQELSIQQLVNVTPRSLLEPNGEVIDIADVAPILEKFGSMFAHERPFTQLPNSHIRFDELYGSFFPTSVVYNVLDDYIEGEADETEISQAFDRLYAHLRAALDKGPVTARIPIYEDSYNSIVGKQIYSPTEAEILEGPVGYHFGLFVYYDDDENGEPFFEMQDSGGDTFADGGFLRVSARGQLIDGFVEIKDRV